MHGFILARSINAGYEGKTKCIGKKCDSWTTYSRNSHARPSRCAPIASANQKTTRCTECEYRSGKPSPTEAIHVEEDLQGRISYILDGGSTGIGFESTVLDITHEPPVILRPGGITKEMLEEAIGPVIQPTNVEENMASTPKAPGMKYTHYAPNAPVYLIDCNEEIASQAIHTLRTEGQKVALLAPDSFLRKSKQIISFQLVKKV